MSNCKSYNISHKQVVQNLIVPFSLSCSFASPLSNHLWPLGVLTNWRGNAQTWVMHRSTVCQQCWKTDSHWNISPIQQTFWKAMGDGKPSQWPTFGQFFPLSMKEVGWHIHLFFCKQKHETSKIEDISPSHSSQPTLAHRGPWRQEWGLSKAEFRRKQTEINVGNSLESTLDITPCGRKGSQIGRGRSGVAMQSHEGSANPKHMLKLGWVFNANLDGRTRLLCSHLSGTRYGSNPGVKEGTVLKIRTMGD